MEADLFTPASRRTDPESSHKAEQEITQDGSRASDCAVVLLALQNMHAKDASTGFTAREISHYTGDKMGSYIDRHTVEKRLNDLRHDGYVLSQQNYRKCSITAKLCQVWWANEERL